MSWMGIEFIAFMVVYGGTAVVEAITFGKVWKGTRYRVILWILAMLIGSNISYLIEAAFGYESFVNDIENKALFAL